MMFIVNATDTVRPVLSQSQQHRLLSIIAPPPPHVARRHLYPSLFDGTVVEGMYSNQCPSGSLLLPHTETESLCVER